MELLINLKAEFVQNCLQNSGINLLEFPVENFSGFLSDIYEMLVQGIQNNRANSTIPKKISQLVSNHFRKIPADMLNRVGV